MIPSSNGIAVRREETQRRVLEITSEVADFWGRLQSIRPLPAVDALIAATALHHDLTLVTRNEADFDGLGLKVLNPFQAPGS